jgi:hypothetical protein
MLRDNNLRRTFLGGMWLDMGKTTEIDNWLISNRLIISREIRIEPEKRCRIS